MATMSLISLAGAPGTYVNERTGVTSGAVIASFSTVYMLVETPSTVSEDSQVFPPNTPLPVFSLEDYRNYIGGVVPTSGSDLLSYLNVESFFRNSNGGDLRVVRVATPKNVVKLTFNPWGSKDNGSSVPSPIEAGDSFYVQLRLNGLGLGEKTTTGLLRGVEVTAPVGYRSDSDPEDIENNLILSLAIRDAVAEAIRNDRNISSSVYIRGEGIDPETGTANLLLAGRTFGQLISVINLTEPIAGSFALGASGFNVSPVSISESPEEHKQDYLQTIYTAFDDSSLPQGYLLAPTAFSKFREEDRVAIGQAMEAVASDDNHKWLALVDPGAYNVTDIDDYKDFTEHSSAQGFRYGEKYLINNAIYEWTDEDDYLFDTANYSEVDPAGSVNSNVLPGYQNRVSLEDDARSDINSSNTLTDVLTLSQDVPSGPKYLTGASVLVHDSNIAGLPDGSYHAILSDIDSSLQSNQLKLAASVSDALSDNPIDILSDGSGVLTYADPAWSKKVRINEKSSNLIESVVSSGASFNASYLPASLQKPTDEIAFRQNARAINTPALYATHSDYIKIAAANVNTTTGVITATAHGFQTGDVVYVDLLGTASLTTASVTGGSVTGVGGVIAAGDYVNGTYTAVATTAAPSGGTGCTLNFTVSQNGITSVSIAAAGATYLVGNVLTVASGAHGDAFTVTVTHISSTVNAGDVEGTYFAIVLTPNTLKLAASDRNAYAGVALALNAATNDAGFTAVGVLAKGPDLVIHIKGHGFQDGESVYLDKNITSTGGAIVLGASTSSTTYRYFIRKVDADAFKLALSPAALGSNVYLNIPNDGIAVNTTTPGTVFYGDLQVSTSGSLKFTKTNEIRVIRGRKYRINVSLASLPLLDVKGTAVEDYKTTLRFAQSPFSSGRNNYLYDYFITDDGTPISKELPFLGSENYLCVPVEADDLQTVIYAVGCVHFNDTTPVETTIPGGGIKVSFSSFVEPPASLWNFKAVTSPELIDEAQRGVNSINGSVQARIVDYGIDSHYKLFNDSQLYRSSRGFLAYYGPYIKNEGGYWVSPTPYVAGLAMRRYRAEGYQFPPAGTKYQLRGALDCQIRISSAEQNVSNPYGLNTLRQLSGYPKNSVFVWGARTRVNPNSPEESLYKFVNTRVILNVIYGSLSRSFDSDIFSVVDGKDLLFTKIRSSAQNTLYIMYQAGALFGRRPEDAYEVVCNRKNNPAGLLEAGIVNLSVFVVPSPTMERIQVDLVRVQVDGVKDSLEAAGFSSFTIS